MRFRIASALLIVVAVAAMVRLRADGTEALGPASIPIASGTGVVAGGTGMITQPGVISLAVPAGTVEQVLLYWEGFADNPNGGDDTVSISNGGAPVSVTGTLIGGQNQFFGNAYPITYRADITALGLVAAGVTNTLTLTNMSFATANNGAGVMVIFDDGSSDAGIQVRDGSDAAFIHFSPPLDGTVPQTFSFSSSNQDRTANLDMFFASVEGSVSGGAQRPNSLEITTNGPGGGTTILSNVLNSNSGDEFDYFTVAANVPAGATSLTVQAFSRDDLNTGGLPASLIWLAGAFSIEPETPPTLPGRMTGGGSVFTIGDVRVTRGFQIHCDLREPNNLEVNWPGNRFHTTALTSAVCIDQASIAQAPPNAPFDTFIGTGVGKLNNKTGGRIEFVFVDAGEPGTSDTATLKIFDPSGNLVLDVTGDPNVPGFLDRGNVQAHKDNPPKK